ncbi:hypothetical protein JCM1841_005489 [Sporobolomyces salmonicolor]
MESFAFAPARSVLYFVALWPASSTPKAAPEKVTTPKEMPLRRPIDLESSLDHGRLLHPGGGSHNVVLRAPAFTFLDHSPPFSSRDIRQSLNATATPTQPALRLPEIGPDECEALWRWLQRGRVSAREVDTHWRALHGILITRARLHLLQHSSSPACIFCGAKDTVTHAYMECEYSLAYRDELEKGLHLSLSTGFSADTFSFTQILLGLPILHTLVDDSVKPTLRTLVAISLQTLHDARYARIRTTNPTPSSPLPSTLASLALYRLGNRLL